MDCPLVYLRLSTLLSPMTKVQADFTATKWSFKSFEVLLVTPRFLQMTRDEFDAMIMNAACRIPQYHQASTIRSPYPESPSTLEVIPACKISLQNSCTTSNISSKPPTPSSNYGLRPLDTFYSPCKRQSQLINNEGIVTVLMILKHSYTSGTS